MPRFETSFDDLENDIGRALPASARAHRAWWANSRNGQPQSRAWLDVGWTVAAVDLKAERVIFKLSSEAELD
jgi:hypothetical protein